MWSLLIIALMGFKRNTNKRLNNIELKLSMLSVDKPIVRIVAFVIPTIISVISIILAYQSYNVAAKELTYNVSKIDEKRTDLVIDLLTEIKNIYIRINVQYDSGMHNFPLIPHERYIDYYLAELPKEQKELRVLFIAGDKDEVLSEIEKIALHPLLPKEIKEKLGFLITKGGESPSKNLNEYKARIYWSKKGQSELIGFDQWIVEFDNDCTIEEYLLKFKDVILQCNSWLDKHYDLSDELNI